MIQVCFSVAVTTPLCCGHWFQYSITMRELCKKKIFSSFVDIDAENGIWSFNKMIVFFNLNWCQLAKFIAQAKSHRHRDWKSVFISQTIRPSNACTDELKIKTKHSACHCLIQLFNSEIVFFAFAQSFLSARCTYSIAFCLTQLVICYSQRFLGQNWQ